jgi:hypothetical protein
MATQTTTYQLKYLFEASDKPSTYSSDTPVNIGDVIEVDNSLFHCVVYKTELNPGTELELSEEASSPAAALYQAIQRGHTSEH